MFEDMWNDEDLEYTVNVLRVHVLTLKKSGDPYELSRLYGTLARAMALHGMDLDAQDALNDAEFLVVEHGWRGTDKEIWGLYDRALVMRVFGRIKNAYRGTVKARGLLREDSDPELVRLLTELEGELEIEFQKCS